jgi:hypothetical protein
MIDVEGMYILCSCVCCFSVCFACCLQKCVDDYLQLPLPKRRPACHPSRCGALEAALTLVWRCRVMKGNAHIRNHMLFMRYTIEMLCN